jgi:hypothetical protein
VAMGHLTVAALPAERTDGSTYRRIFSGCISIQLLAGQGLSAARSQVAPWSRRAEWHHSDRPGAPLGFWRRAMAQAKCVPIQPRLKRGSWDEDLRVRDEPPSAPKFMVVVINAEL